LIAAEQKRCCPTDLGKRGYTLAGQGDRSMPEQRTPDKDEDTRPLHGPRNEVTWEGGSGRQPYANHGDEEAAEPGAPETPEGNRGDLSGRNSEQVDEARGKP
jgi:hypothetical protein